MRIIHLPWLRIERSEDRSNVNVPRRASAETYLNTRPKVLYKRKENVQIGAISFIGQPNSSPSTASLLTAR